MTSSLTATASPTAIRCRTDKTCSPASWPPPVPSSRPLRPLLGSKTPSPRCDGRSPSGARSSRTSPRPDGGRCSSALAWRRNCSVRCRARPSAGALFSALAKVEAVQPDLLPVLRRLVLAAQAAWPDVDPAEMLLAATRAWIDTQVEEPRDLVAPRTPPGSPPDAQALVTQMDHLIAARSDALTDHAIQTRPAWLAELGPIPARRGRAGCMEATGRSDGRPRGLRQQPGGHGTAADETPPERGREQRGVVTIASRRGHVGDDDAFFPSAELQQPIGPPVPICERLRPRRTSSSTCRT